MKRKNFNKRLVLHKSTITNLDDAKLNKARGGTFNSSVNEPCACKNTSNADPCDCCPNTSRAEPCTC